MAKGNDNSSIRKGPLSPVPKSQGSSSKGSPGSVGSLPKGSTTTR